MSEVLLKSPGEEIDIDISRAAFLPGHTEQRPLIIRSYEEAIKIATLVSESGDFDLRGNSGRALARIMYGAEIGLSPIVALAGLFNREGHICMRATTAVALVRASGKYDFENIEISAERATVRATRLKKGKQVGTRDYTLTMEEAKIAHMHEWVESGHGYRQKDIWIQAPAACLWARIAMQAIRWECSDVFGGMPIYDPEELSDKMPADEHKGEQKKPDTNGQKQAPQKPIKPIEAPHKTVKTGSEHQFSISETIGRVSQSREEAAERLRNAKKAAMDRNLDAAVERLKLSDIPTAKVADDLSMKLEALCLEYEDALRLHYRAPLGDFIAMHPVLWKDILLSLLSPTNEKEALAPLRATTWLAPHLMTMLVEDIVVTVKITPKGGVIRENTESSQSPEDEKPVTEAQRVETNERADAEAEEEASFRQEGFAEEVPF